MNAKDKDVTLNYIDKAHTNLHVLGKKINRIISAIVLICSILLALNFNVISLSNNITILGLTIELETSLLFVILCVFCYFLQLFLLGLGIKESENSDLIIKLYGDLGFEDESLKSNNGCVLEYPNPLIISFSQRMMGENKFVSFCNEAAFLIYTIMLFLIPLTTQGFVLYRIYNEVPVLHWKFIIVGVLCFLSFINLLNGVFKLFPRSEKNTQED